MESTPTAPSSSSFLERNDFILRRLHSLSGLIPVGAYMVVHLLTNASVNNGVETFQNSVYMIHSLGKVLWIVEWVFIFIPLLFHAIFGVIIVQSGLPNHSSYRYTNNFRYSLQRATGMIAFLFIMWHVFHMHGWFHFGPWVHNIVEPLGGGLFRPYNAASTAAEALKGSIIVQILYFIGVMSCVFHLANGIWTMGITWGVWVTPASQRWANYVCATFGVLLALVSLGALGGFLGVDPKEAKAIEDRMYQARSADGSILEDEHKRSHDEPGKEMAKADK